MTKPFIGFDIGLPNFPGATDPELLAELLTVYNAIKNIAVNTHVLAEYTVANLPNAVTNPRMVIYVSNESGGAVPAFSDGTNWRRVTDRIIVS